MAELSAELTAAADGGEWSHVGTAALAILNAQHANQQRTTWNARSGRVVGPLHTTPTFVRGPGSTDPAPSHPAPPQNDWGPIKKDAV